MLHREEGGWVLHRQDGCCMGRMNAAQGGCGLHREDECCTRRMGAALGEWVLHREDGCCTGRMGVAQGGWVLHREHGCCTGRLGAAQRRLALRKEDGCCIAVGAGKRPRWIRDGSNKFNGPQNTTKTGPKIDQHLRTGPRQPNKGPRQPKTCAGHHQKLLKLGQDGPRQAKDSQG